jgi:hypothetical protein
MGSNLIYFLTTLETHIVKVYQYKFLLHFRYVISIETSEDREEYLREMLDPGRSQQFFQELKTRESDSAAKYQCYSTFFFVILVCS